MLSLLENDLLNDDLFSLLVFGTLITMVVASVELQRNIKKVIQVKVGADELALFPVYFRRAIEKTTIDSIMNLEYNEISPEIPLREVKNHRKFPNQDYVVSEGNMVVGIVSQKDVDKAIKEKNEGKVKDIMHEKFQTAIPQEFLFSAISKLNSNPAHIVPVLDPISLSLVGTITSEKIMSLLIQKESNSK